jgi:UDP-2,3-diacylglucosamine pyrophosphatase LpxH
MPLIKKLIKDVENIKPTLLEKMQDATFPKTLTEWKQALLDVGFSATNASVEDAFDELETDGYDIKKVVGKETRYGLVRHGQFGSDAYYKILGNVKLPCLLTTDWHVDSKSFTKIGFNKMLQDVDKHKCKDVIMMGDLLQGLGVYSTEAMDVLEPSIDKQEQHLIKLLRQFPTGTNFHAIMGNHEEKIKGTWKVGHDALRPIAHEVDNFNYYGHVAKLQLEKKWNIMMIHGSGSAAGYAISYNAQRLYERLPEQPDLLLMGHVHRLMVLPMPLNKYIMICGTLQRENSWLMQKGIIAQIGWIILRDFTKTGIDVVISTPEVF